MSANLPSAGTGRRRWPYLLGLAGLLLAALLLGEGMGLTQLVESAQDYRRGQGTLVVQIEDSEAEVRIAGQGRLHEGQGEQEVRLPPGRYEVRIGKAGRPWYEQSIDLAGGERLVLECTKPAPARRDWVGKRPFVLLGRGEQAEVGFDTLREAIDEAGAGDTIEVRGDGPFVGPPLVQERPLTIRAGRGHRPVLRMSPEGKEWLLTSRAALVLEGLDLDGWTIPAEARQYRGLVYCTDRAVLANCRLRVRGPSHGVGGPSPHLVFRNCEFFCVSWHGVAWSVRAAGSLALDNCLFIRSPISIELDAAVPGDVSVRLNRNTWLGREHALEVRLGKPNLLDVARPIRCEANDNVFRYTRALAIINQWPDEPLGPAEIEALTRRLLAWKEKGNVYPPTVPLLKYTRRFADLPGSEPIKELSEWYRFWGIKGMPSSQAEVRFAAADLDQRLSTAAEKVVPEDFRLTPDSPGKGADLALVGPGPAYERWKKTRDYQRWLKQTGQVR